MAQASSLEKRWGGVSIIGRSLIFQFSIFSLGRGRNARIWLVRLEFHAERRGELRDLNKQCSRLQPRQVRLPWRPQRQRTMHPPTRLPSGCQMATIERAIAEYRRAHDKFEAMFEGDGSTITSSTMAELFIESIAVHPAHGDAIALLVRLIGRIDSMCALKPSLDITTAAENLAFQPDLFIRPEILPGGELFLQPRVIFEVEFNSRTFRAAHARCAGFFARVPSLRAAVLIKFLRGALTVSSLRSPCSISVIHVRRTRAWWLMRSALVLRS